MFNAGEIVKKVKIPTGEEFHSTPTPQPKPIETKQEAAQKLAEALMDAEVRIGEILLAMPKASGKQENKGNQYKSGEIDTAVVFSKIPILNPKPPVQTKSEAIKSLGFDNKQAERFQTLAQHTTRNC